jgi:GNAT superfamily N-acetyltransferase
MAHDNAILPVGLHLAFEPDPAIDTRRLIWSAIEAFHGRTVPGGTERFALLVRDPAGELAAGLSAALYWGWLFVDGLWVGEALRGQGIGRALMARAEEHAIGRGCHSAWLDTFQAQNFYARLGYASFGVLEDYPPGQSRHFMRKRLHPAS